VAVGDRVERARIDRDGRHLLPLRSLSGARRAAWPPAREMIAYCTRAPGPDELESFRQRRRTSSPLALQVDQGVGGETGGCGEVPTSALEQGGGEGGIEEDDVESAHRSAQPLKGVAPHDVDPERAQTFAFAVQMRHERGVGLHHGDACRPARRRFEAQASAAGKEIQTGGTLYPGTEPVEQGLLDPVRRRPGAAATGKSQAPPPPLSGDDPRPARQPAALRFRDRLRGWISACAEMPGFVPGVSRRHPRASGNPPAAVAAM